MNDSIVLSGKFSSKLESVYGSTLLFVPSLQAAGSAAQILKLTTMDGCESFPLMPTERDILT